MANYDESEYFIESQEEVAEREAQEALRRMVRTEIRRVHTGAADEDIAEDIAREEKERAVEARKRNRPRWMVWAISAVTGDILLAEEAKKVYNSFDLKTEMGNGQFLKLLNSGIDVKTAYEVVHMGEIIPAAMQFAAKTVETNTAKAIASGANRPRENGMGSSSPALVKSDVSQLSKADRQEIIRRVQRGEKIRF